MTAPPSAPTRQKFDWLRDDRFHRRGNLIAVAAAVRSGAIGPDDAPELADILAELALDATPRESMRIAAVVLAMDRYNLATATARHYVERVAVGRRPRGRPPGS
jgi:hypothetical protein